MSFLYRKNDLFFTIKSVIARFLKSDIHAYNKSVKNTGNYVYECAIFNYYEKLQILEENLEKADKIRANTHKTIIKKSAEKINLLKKTICNKESDLLIVGPAATGLTTSKDFEVFVVFVLPNDESNDFLKNLKKMKCKHIEKKGKLITANKKLWNEKKDKLVHYFNASIPRTKLNFGDGTKITIKFSSHNSLKITNLIRYYAESDPRYRKVFMYIKSLASKLKIIDAYNGLLSNHQISVLVAHFLQRSLRDQQPVFPVIPQVCSSFVSPNLPLKEVVENLKKPVDVSGIQCLINPNPLASHLSIQFVDYFANFDFLSKAIFLDKIDPVEMLQVDSPPKLQIFDLYSDKNISKGDRALEAFSESMKYVQNLIKEGYCIDDFSNLPGLNDFKKKLRKNRAY